jgi:predicted ABC-type ATPase
MMDPGTFDRRPLIVALAGPNGAGKTTFYHAHLASSGLLFVNADVLAKELEIDAYDAAGLADSMRRTLLMRGESFVFETVFSDPVGEKIEFMEGAIHEGYEVVLCYIGVNNSRQSRERVAMRVSQGGHDVSDQKLRDRFPRILQNLRQALVRLPHVFIYDNSDLNRPYRHVARCEAGKLEELQRPVPVWLRPVIRGLR